jgi:uncharacterized membrane protein YoaK (UPF0700 family)
MYIRSAPPISRFAARKHCWWRCCLRSPAAILTPTPGFSTAFWPTRNRPNVVFLWVEAMARRWEEAFRYVPPILAFTVGVVVASWLRRSAGGKAGEVSLLIEIVMLLVVGVLHNRLPDLAGTLGISFVAAIQTSIFTKVEGLTYSSVMITGNMRQAIEGVFEAVSGRRDLGGLRRACIFIGLCAAFGTGAAVGALLTEQAPVLTLGLPIAVLLVVLLCCETGRMRQRA